ncbi:MAG: RagB/SusD family nutrient uptake outer membrane protein [Tannerellaceae bacterium]|nr:RagB/SusD family nutrient uptake outer membrane protein [Tannerellaceae bacterium]
MKKIYMYVIGAFLFAAGMTSCGEDFLEVDHYGIVEPEVLLTSQEYVEQGLNGVYDLMYPERGSGASDISSGWLLKPHMAMANYPALDVQPDGWDVAFSRQAWTTDQAEFLGGWTRAYNAIDRANRFLDNLNSANPNVFEEGQKTLSLIEAQARAIRGYFYTFLVQNFGGVPLLQTGETYSTHPGKERGTTEEAWNMIIADLEFARDQLDWQPWKNQKGRVTKGMAKAYLAQAYMYNHRFADAKKELKDIIDSNVYSLNPCFGQIHLPGYHWQPESVWEIAFPEWETMGWGTEGKYDAIWWPIQLKGNKEYGGWGPHYVSYEFCWSFEPGDKRLQYEVARYGEKNPFVVKQTEGDASIYNRFGPEFGTVGLQPGWRSAFITSDVMPNNSDMKWWRGHISYKGREYDPVSATQFRLAGVYLNYAECCFETEGENSAEGWNYIQKIRDRAWGALEVGLSQDVTPGLFGKEFPIELNQDPSVKAPDARTFYATYKRTPGKLGGSVKKLVGGDQLSPVYEDTEVYTSYQYKPYTSPAWKVALTIERRHELFIEFSLWYDICRMGMAQEYLDAEYPQNSEVLIRQDIPGYTDKGYSDVYIPNPHTIRSYAHNPSREIFPIPQGELDKNPALGAGDQNPGY